MNAPDTIYLQIHDDECSADCTDTHEVTWCQDQINDHDTAYVRADLPYELAKTVEAQKAEIARLIKALNRYGEHSPECTRFGPGAAGDECTCGFTAALRGE